MDTEKSCAVTGASGYLGSLVAAWLEAQGWTVMRLARANSGPGWHSFQLNKGLEPGFFSENNIQALVHCAWDLKATGWPDIMQTNVEGSKLLLQQARRESVGKAVFVSTMSAFPDCKSLYGKSKLLVEKEAQECGYTVVRPGLIYGQDSGGMVGALTSMLKTSPVLPVIAGDALLYLTHEDDLCRLIETLLDAALKPDPLPAISAVYKTPMRFVDILKRLSAKAGKQPLLVPVPWQAAFVLMKGMEKIKLRAPFRSDSVLSLANQNPCPDLLPTEALGVQFRELS